MTYESEVAKEIGYRFEAKKDTWKQIQSGDYKFTLTINPGDIPYDMIKDEMGQRYMCVIVPLNEDETPRETPKPKSYAGQAKRLANDKIFRHYLEENAYGQFLTREDAEKHIEEHCKVKSCSELVEGTEAGHKFRILQAEYMSWKTTPPIEAYENDMRDY